MLVVAFSLLLGIFLTPHLEAGAWPWGLLLAAFPLILVLRKLKLRAHLAVGLIFFAVGILWTQVWLAPAAPEPGAYTVRGRVYGEPTIRTENRMTFLLGEVQLGDEPQKSMAYCTMNTYGEQLLPVLFDGAEITFSGRVYEPMGKSGPHDFDFRQWLFQNGISYGISGIRDLQIHNTAQTAAWYDISSRLRTGMREALTRVMGEEARLAMAMLVSEREGLAQDETEAFQRTGIAHVMSVSGLHVGIVAGLLLWLLKKMRVRQGLSLPIMAVLLAGYCMLTGFSVAAVRAGVMLVIALAAQVLHRRTDPLITLSTAMTAVLLINPLQLFSAGFVLSFSAMAGIMLLNPRFLQLFGRGRRSAYKRRAEQKRMHADHFQNGLKKQLRQLPEMLSLSLSAQLGVLLPTAAYFHQLPLYGLAINLLIVPLVGVLVPLYFVTLALSPVPLLGMAVGWVAKMLSAGLLWLVELLSTLPYAVIRVASAPVFIVCGALLCAVLFSWYFRAGARTKLVTVALVVALSFTGAYLSRPSDLRYIQLSVEQADAALIMDGNKTIAVDVGEFGDAASGYLLAEGKDLDAVFLTHLHIDHALGVQDLLASGISIGKVFLPAGAADQQLGTEAVALLQMLRAANIPVAELAAGDEVRYNKVAFTVLWPRRESVRRMQDANDSSLVMRIDFDGYTILSASDLTGSYEAYAAVPCDVLKVAHHGSAASTFDAFLDFVSPKIALISCASGDRALPAQATLERLDTRGISVFRTDETGDITLTVRDEQLWLTKYKEGDAE